MRELIWDTFFEADTSPLRVLDLGCGYDYFLPMIGPASPCLVGMDFSRAALVESSRRTDLVDLVQGDGIRLPFRNSCIDLVTCFDVLEHTSCPDTVIKEISRVLSKGGKFILTTYNFDGLKYSLIRKGLMTDDPTHISVLRTEEWKDILGEAGFRPVKCLKCFRGICFNVPFTRNTKIFVPLQIPFGLGTSLLILSEKEI